MDRTPQQPLDTCKTTYDKLIGNLNMDKEKVNRSKEKIKIYTVQGREIDGAIVWEFKIH